MTHIHIHLCHDDDTEFDTVVELEPLDAVEAIERQRDLERRHADALFFDAHREEFQAIYPERWVAIHQQQVIGVNEEFDDLLSQLDAANIPRGRAYVDRASDDGDDDLVIVFS